MLDGAGGGCVAAGVRQRESSGAKVMRLHWHTVNAIMNTSVDKGLKQREREPIAYFGLDEPQPRLL